MRMEWMFHSIIYSIIQNTPLVNNKQSGNASCYFLKLLRQKQDIHEMIDKNFL